jgi:arylsulfatase A-like enzyme
MKVIPGIKYLSLIFVYMSATLAVRSQDTNVKRNVLIIMTDQQSANALSFIAGKKYLHTPNIDKLAGKGVVFTDAYCANPLCTPSRSSMFTGRYPHELGIQDNSNKKLDAGLFPTLGNIFSENGYETGYAGKWHLPFPQGDKAKHGFQWMENNKLTGVDSLLPGSATRFISEKRSKPFLLVVSFVNPHNICEWARDESLEDGEIGIAPASTATPPLLANYKPTQNENDINRDMRIALQANPKFPVGNYSEAKWREYRWAYYRMIELVDGYIGEILDAMEAAGKSNNTLIVFLSDHGDMQGAHQWNQKTVLYEESSRVPFILTGPGIPVKKSNTLVNTGIDLIPTLCDYTGIKPSVALPGRNLLGADTGRAFVVIQNKLSVAKNIFPDREKFEPEGRMLRSKTFKYWIYDDGKQRESLFDIEKDPGEMKDLAAEAAYKKELEAHRKLLREWAEKYKDNKAISMLDFLTHPSFVHPGRSKN